MTVKVKSRVAPDFMLTNLDGQRTRLSDYRGYKNVILVFNRGFF